MTNRKRPGEQYRYNGAAMREASKQRGRDTAAQSHGTRPSPSSLFDGAAAVDRWRGILAELYADEEEEAEQ